MYKRLIVFCLLLFSFFVNAQELKVNRVELVNGDDYAMTYPRRDNNNVVCAVLKIYFNQEEYGQIQFSSSLMLGEADYKDGYYVVYVADNTKNLTIRNSMSTPVSINFRDYGISIESGKTYRIDMDATGLKNTQTILFSMLPIDGYIDIDGKKREVIDGKLQIELKPGNYHYKAYDRDGYYVDKEGSIDVSENIIETKVIPLKLEQRKAEVTFKCNVDNATLYVDNTEYGFPGIKSIPLGEHEVRVVGKDSKEYLDKVTISTEKAITWNIKLKPSAYLPVCVYGSNCLFVDNKKVYNWSSGKIIMVKSGKHLFTTAKDDLGNESKSRVFEVNQYNTVLDLRHAK